MKSYLQERELLLFSVEKIYQETTNHVQFLKANLWGGGRGANVQQILL